MSLIYVCSSGGDILIEDVSIYCAVFVALLIKLGSAPFHQWFPSVASGLSWLINFILITWQKLAPLILVSYIISYNYVFIIAVGLRCVVGSLGGINQSSMRKLIAYSSINHLGWMLLGAYHGVGYLLVYYLIYILIRLVIVYYLLSSGIYYLSQMYYLIPVGGVPVLFGLNWISFGGLPPFIGFFPKWVLIRIGITSGQFILLRLIILISLFSLFYYTRVIYVVIAQSGVLSLLNNFKISGVVIIVSYLMVLSGLLFVPLLLLLI